MEKEKLFNLQLTIQKLEEELSLYRNGTTAEEMFDLIKEKEAELETIKSKLNNKEETLKRLAKSSGDVLNKYDVLLAEKLQLEDEFKNHSIHAAEIEHKMNTQLHETSRALQINEEKLEDISVRFRDLNEINAYMTKSVVEKDAYITSLKETIYNNEREATKSKAEDDTVNKLRSDLQSRDSTIQHLKDSLGDSDRSIEKLQKRCADLLAEKAEKVRQLDQERVDMMGHVTKFKDMMGSNMAQRDEALKRRDDKIKEVRKSHVLTTHSFIE